MAFGISSLALVDLPQRQTVLIWSLCATEQQLDRQFLINHINSAVSYLLYKFKAFRNEVNKILPALGRRKHFQSCQVEGGITHSHPVSSKKGLEIQKE